MSDCSRVSPTGKRQSLVILWELTIKYLEVHSKPAVSSCKDHFPNLEGLFFGRAKRWGFLFFLFLIYIFKCQNTRMKSSQQTLQLQSRVNHSLPFADIQCGQWVAIFKFLPWIYLAYNFTKEKHRCIDVPLQEFIFCLVLLKSPDYFFFMDKYQEALL